MINKNILFLSVILIVFSCNKDNSNENGYIYECSDISELTHQTMKRRNDACKSCCIENGWENGAYWDVGTEGCQCHK